MLAAMMLTAWTAMPSVAATLINENIPLAGAVFNPCNGETVSFQGTDHETIHETIDKAGGFHLSIHDNIHVTAVGDQGNTYVGNQVDNFTVNAKVGEEETSTFSFSEISRGSAPNFVVKALFHITVHADGTVSAFVDNFTAECRG
jgi:hypothetical protein